MRTKRFFAVLFLLLIVVFPGCSKNNFIVDTNSIASPSSSTSSSSQSSESTIATTMIEDLPTELLISRESSGNAFWYAGTMAYTFDIDKETVFAITTQIDKGSIELSIKDKGTDKVIYSPQHTESLADHITLGKGTYSVVINGKLYSGFLHILLQDEASTGSPPTSTKAN